MATVHKCDRCGKIDKTAWQSLHVDRPIREPGQVTGESDFTLCEACGVSLADWMNADLIEEKK